MRVKLRAPTTGQAFPVVAIGNTDIAVVRWLGVLVRHLEEDQVGELLKIVAVAHTVIAQRGAEIPDPGDNGRRIQCRDLLCLSGVASCRFATRLAKIWA